MENKQENEMKETVSNSEDDPSSICVMSPAIAFFNVFIAYGMFSNAGSHGGIALGILLLPITFLVSICTFFVSICYLFSSKKSERLASYISIAINSVVFYYYVNT